MTERKDFVYRDSCFAYDTVQAKQLDYCNAYVRKLVRNGRVVAYELVSYCTPVCVVSFANDNPVLECSANCTCSNTTRNHVGRFLKEYAPMFNYYDAKRCADYITKSGTGSYRLKTCVMNSDKEPKAGNYIMITPYLLEPIKPFPVCY